MNSLNSVKRNLAFPCAFSVTCCVSTEKFAKNLSELMSSRGLTIAGLAKKSGVHYVMISNYLKGGKSGKLPSLKTLIKLAQALHCTVDELLGISESHDVGKPEPPMSDKVRRIVQFLETLEDTDPLKDYLIKLIAAKSDSHDTEGGGHGR